MSAVSSRHLPPLHEGRHALHADDRAWSQTNCYLDAWIQVLGLLGLPAEPVGLAALSSDAQPGQWSMLKGQTDDVRRLYDIDVAEINVWRPLEQHVIEHLAADDLVTLETDSWFLPDLGGLSYRLEHSKTTIVPLEIDPDAKRLVYLHNADRDVVEGPDYDGALAVPGTTTCVPHPYVERIALRRWAADPGRVVAELPRRALDLARDHLSRAPQDNPVARLVQDVRDVIPELILRGRPFFHGLSFATTRPLGVSAQNAVDGLDWLLARAPEDAIADRAALASAVECFTRVSENAKRLQFGLARIASGRDRDLGPLLAALQADWAAAMSFSRSGLLG